MSGPKPGDDVRTLAGWVPWTAAADRELEEHRRELKASVDRLVRRGAKPMQPVMVRMPEGMYAAVKRSAEVDDRPVSWVIRRAVTEYLKRHP